MSALPSFTPTEDFWSRQANAQTHVFECAPYGIPAIVTANDAGVLSAARLSAGRYSAADEIAGHPIRIQIAVQRGSTLTPPANLEKRLVYTGLNEWIILSAGEWGHGFANLQTRIACIALSSTLAADARFVSRYFIDHYVLNLALTEWAMLHASCVLDADRRRLIIMVATHNTGKSTAALRLARAGFAFLADGMALFKTRDNGLIVGGYPIGEVKLRDDVLTWFPEYTGETVRVREQQKTIVNLRAAHPDRVVESLVEPEAIHLVFVERRETPPTSVAAIDASEAARFIAGNTAYWNEAAQLAHNTATLQRLLQIAQLHRVYLGSDPQHFADTIRRL